MTKEELRKSLDFVNEERERLQRELERKDNIINELKKIFDKEDYQYLQRKIKELENGRSDK